MAAHQALIEGFHHRVGIQTTQIDANRALMVVVGLQTLGMTAQGVNEAAPQALARLAIEHRIPTACEWRSMAQAGCLLGFGPDIVELRRRTGDFIARILKGANPAELPVEQPTRLELIANLRTARALGLELPQALLARADEVIE